MERTRAKLGIHSITMHDLRRTAGTYMSQYGVPKDERERILNHGGMRNGSITESVYNRYEYDAEKRAALEFWANVLLAGIIGGRPTEVRGYHARFARQKDRTRSRSPERLACPALRSARAIVLGGTSQSPRTESHQWTAFRR
jgi:hypothetical protein